MHLIVNGQTEMLDEVRSISDLLLRLPIPQQRVAVMVNGSVVRRADHAATELHDGDNVEIITMVGGG